MSIAYLEFLDLKVVGYQHHFLNCTRTQMDSEIAKTFQRKKLSAYLSWNKNNNYTNLLLTGYESKQVKTSLLVKIDEGEDFCD